MNSDSHAEVFRRVSKFHPEIVTFRYNDAELHVKGEAGAPIFLGVPGLSGWESWARLGAQIGDRLGIPSLRDVGGSDYGWMNSDDVCGQAWQAKYTSASLDVLTQALEDRNFSLQNYADIINNAFETLSLYRKEGPEVVFAESVGTVATLKAIVDRIKQGRESLPQVLILVDCLIEGLSPGAFWYLQQMGQLESNPLKGLLEILPKSEELEKHPEEAKVLKELREDLQRPEIVEKFPKIISFYGTVGDGWIAGPWCGVPKTSNIGKFLLKMGFQEGDDGMVNLSGAKMENFPQLKKAGKILAIPIIGSVHSQDRKNAAQTIGRILQAYRSRGLDALSYSDRQLFPEEIDCRMMLIKRRWRSEQELKGVLKAVQIRQLVRALKEVIHKKER